MSLTRDDAPPDLGENSLAASGSETPPAPSPALMSAIGTMQPVRTRVPAIALARMLGLGLVLPIIMIAKSGPRKDLADLPLPWVVAMALVWAAGAGLTLTRAVIPRRGDVLPDALRAWRSVVVTAVVLLLLGLFATLDAPGRAALAPETLASFAHSWWHCIRAGVLVAIPVLIAAMFSLRRLLPVGSVRVAAAVGAGGGALGGLTLHFVCAVGGGLHVGLAHAGAVVFGAVLGMLILTRTIKSA
jgi:hypothetical protein